MTMEYVDLNSVRPTGNSFFYVWKKYVSIYMSLLIDKDVCSVQILTMLVIKTITITYLPP